ncbi:hypothetical protein BU26DRAFT_569078 [Trematosphaeria pertusa]|uniref:F-box domain-containing protein n=1 Tax=Trematosphaeria pertusa TaxID=390896 RepID=A0A6A6I173_9PLEO|nr:uncharacterized protein BU26DRAFT_569078 [Trematosphaeria pertusa]KAF2244071.1 hypothetical protein BU26DRAFT_569078 [Trematosphaeria pertusa]
MSLVSLPAELVRQILHTLDPTSFYLCLQTSKLFREHALASKALLFDQLLRIPGPRLREPYTTYSAESLIRIFGIRATQHLAIGAPWMADRHIWRASPCMDRKLSKILRWNLTEEDEHWLGIERITPGPLSRNRLIFAEVVAYGAVNIFSIRKSHKDDPGGYRPMLEHAISQDSLTQYLPPYGSGSDLVHTYRVVKVAGYKSSHRNPPFGSKLAVLYSPILGIASGLPGASYWSRLLCFRLDSQFGPVVIDTFDIETNKGESVAAMAVDSDGNPVIAFRCFEKSMEGYRVYTYKNVEDELTLERRTMRNPEEVGPLYPLAPERIADISIQGKAIHLLPNTIPMPHWTTHSPIPPQGILETMARRDTYLPDVVDIFPKQPLGRTIAHHHHHMIKEQDLNDGEPTCVNAALELMITRDEPYGLANRVGAFLLKALHYPDGCSHFNLSADYPTLHHVFVAYLAGLPDLHNLSTLGLILAVSPAAHRIAIASWKTVKVWSLDPQAFLDPEYSLAGGEGVPGDYAFIEGCGWRYYDSGAYARDCVVLEPVELPSAGVVFGLDFRDEDELWGWCEPGLVRWKFGVHACGRRDEAKLESAGMVQT